MIVRFIAINSIGWLVVQLSIAAILTRMSSRHFRTDGLLPGVRGWEISLYRRWFRIRRWKRKLPDGSPWVGGGFRKQDLATRCPNHLHQLEIETRRGEAAHWLMLTCFPIFFLWNPPWAWLLIALYAVAANLPCILVQRYNREVVRRMLRYKRYSLGNSVPQISEYGSFSSEQ